MRLSGSEERALWALDFACWEDSDRGGDGWVGLRTVAAIMGVGYAWVSNLLSVLRTRDLVERRWCPTPSWTGSRRRQYALSEAGADLLLALDSPLCTPQSVVSEDQKGER